MLKLSNINVTLSKGTPLHAEILQNLNLQVGNGEFVIIIGSNGCGKSTMFNTIAGFIQPDSGAVIIDDSDVTDVKCARRAALVSLVMQDPRVGTMEHMTIEENLSMAYMRGKARGLCLHNTCERRNLFIEKLALLNMNLENKLDQLVGNLSGGQRQALSLIMAIIADYKILLLDEITAALDPSTADNVMAIAAKLVQEEKRTAIMITHNMHYALTYGNRTLLMNRGKIVREYDAATRSSLTPAMLAADIGEI
ncbi:MAG TPA: ATP-binding cassette domain-containing protein [Gammaproteobacteria bacterium]|nr:ATP-binding cassette domain-containing protein [Gammaproteobacteria bacterium]